MGNIVSLLSVLGIKKRYYLQLFFLTTSDFATSQWLECANSQVMIYDHVAKNQAELLLPA